MIKFISHEHFPDDQYNKEIVYLEIEGKRYGYVAKVTKAGGLFWDEISVGINVDGKKKYYKAFKFDSEFLRDDILAFLKNRSWENRVAVEKYPSSIPYPAQKLPETSYEQTSFLDTCPF